MEKHSVGKTIAALRKQKGWTQVELAERLQVSDKAVSKWEKDDSYPSIEFLPVLAGLFDVTIDYLITGATKVNKEIASTPERIEETINADDPRIISAIYEGVLCIDEILATNDYKLIKKALETYPITTYEIQCATVEGAVEYLSNNNWRDLFKYAVDNGDKKLITYVLARDTVSCSKVLNYRLEQLSDFSYPEGVKSNDKYMRLNGKVTVRDDHKAKLAFVDACKKQIIDNCALKLDMDRVIDDLDEAYFENELAKENFEIIIIKLCVRLEAILRGKYHYEGDFSEMLVKFCDTYSDHADVLHKLRKCRNSIVHSEKTEEVMTIDEIKLCIEYICRMG